MAILLIEKGKGEVVTAPVIRAEIGGGRVQISGRMRPPKPTTRRCCCAPVRWPRRWRSSRSAPSARASALRTSRRASTRRCGASAIAVFMIFYYLLFGCDLGTGPGIQPAVPDRAAVAAAGHADLPGIAAIALTLGMAIDANVLINERIREELRNGMPPQAAIRPATSAPSAPFSTPTSPR
jgi:preprotein translocase subunit SecD